MELGDKVCEGELCEVDVFMVGLKTGVKIDRPLARDIIGYFDIAYLATLQICGDNVISIYIPRRWLATPHALVSFPYRSPRCKLPTVLGSTKQCRAQTALTTPLVM